MKIRLGLKLTKLVMEALILLEGIGWDIVGLMRDARAGVALWAHKRYADELKHPKP